MKEQTEVTYSFKSAKTRKYKEGRVMDVSYERITSYPNGRVSVRHFDDKDKYGDYVHDDLLKSLKAFIPHFMLLSESANINDFPDSYFKGKKWEKDQAPYKVTGVHIKEHNQKRSVILLGQKMLSNGRVISMVAPMVGFEPDEEDEDVYPHHKHLKKAVDNYLTEVEEYMNGKLGKSPQLDAFDPVEEDEKVKKIS